MASSRWCELCPTQRWRRTPATRLFFASHNLEVCDTCAAAYFGTFDRDNPALMQFIRSLQQKSKTRWERARTWDQKEALARLQVAYATRVRSLSRAQLKRHANILNPKGHRIGRSGARGCHQLDHIVPIVLCWEHFVRPEEAAALTNLQVIPWTVNSMRTRDFSVELMLGYADSAFCAPPKEKNYC